MKKFLHSFVEPQTVILWFTYWMHVLVVPALIAIVINYIKVRQYKKYCVNGDLTMVENGNPATLFASHHDWLVRSFIILFIMLMVALGTLYSGFGIVVLAIIVPYWFYRLGKGMWSLAVHRPMPGYYC